MSFVRLFSAISVCAAMVACGGSQKPAVDPAAPAAGSAPADSAAVSAEASGAKASVAVPGAGFANKTDRYSYALGMDLGKAIANVNAPVNMMLLMSAIQDVVDSNRKVLMDDSTAESALQDLLLLMQQNKEADAKAAAQKALDEQNKFLEKNKQDPTVKLTPKGVQYKVITEGTGISPKASDKVQVHYVGALLDGTEFDNSVKRGEPLEFPVNAVIAGWQDLLQVLKEGSKVKAWIPSDLAYGEAGVPPMIPANAMLVFEVELLKVFAEVPPAEEGVAAPAAEAVPAATDGAAAQPTAAPAEAQPAAPAEAKPAK
ncbi:MAG: FKBP-type peptidyl-prolyl cis-trans isomerase [Fibrobacter sp.]|nr:FKBP-type peptidyl-prolyl cis-trans isomerase [Fibrobacter sp.]